MSNSEHPFALIAEERLRSRKSVSKLFNEGSSGFSYPLRYLWMEGMAGSKTSSKTGSEEGSEEGSEADSVPASVLFNVPKRFHRRANKRNLLRRRVKEAYRVQKNRLFCDEEEGCSPLHIALVYSTKDALTYTQIHRAVGKIIDLINDERAKARAKTKEQQLPQCD